MHRLNEDIEHRRKINKYRLLSKLDFKRNFVKHCLLRKLCTKRFLANLEIMGVKSDRSSFSFFKNEVTFQMKTYDPARLYS